MKHFSMPTHSSRSLVANCQGCLHSWHSSSCFWTRSSHRVFPHDDVLDEVVAEMDPFPCEASPARVSSTKRLSGGWPRCLTDGVPKWPALHRHQVSPIASSQAGMCACSHRASARRAVRRAQARQSSAPLGHQLKILRLHRNWKVGTTSLRQLRKLSLQMSSRQPKAFACATQFNPAFCACTRSQLPPASHKQKVHRRSHLSNSASPYMVWETVADFSPE